MRYEKQILEAYDRIGFKPRDRQVEHIDKILIAFLDEKVKNVILSAPTGTGKSIIGAIVADVIHTVKHPGTSAGASFLLTATNVLAHQYHDTFVDDSAPDDNIFHIIKGAGNYECSALSVPEEPQNAESCSIVMFQKQAMDSIIQAHCDSCEYKRSRSKKNSSRHLITNYSWYFLDRMYSTHPMEKRSVCVFDEAHLINDLFVEHNAIFFSEKRLAQFAEEISEQLSVGNTDIFKNLKTIREHLIAGKITDQTYMAYLQTLHATYKQISEAAAREADRNNRNHKKYLTLSKLSKKYYNLGCKIDDLIIFGYPHVFEHKAKDTKKGQHEHEVSVKPIFVGDMFEALDNADHNLLMSATISDVFAKRTMTLPGETKFIKLDPQFPPENKKVIFFKTQALNYTTMKDPATIKKLCASVYQIVDHHTKKGERGIILAPSFVIVQSVSETLRQMGGNYRVFEQQRGEKLADVLEEFKAYTRGPAVLLTPSGFEGIDLPGDLSRFQILCKAPFGSLGDKRVAHILNVYPDIYSLTALMKVTQGAGRSVRSATDWATTYCLDAGIQRLWTSKTNAWADEFKTSFTSQLGDN
jgi:Rad3-related DNA helicase